MVTGGAGYIGSHTVVELLEEGHDVVVIDSLVNSHRLAIERVTSLTGRSVPTIVGDIGDQSLLDRVFGEYAFDAVVHFAGLKAVGESTEKPLLYYDNNVGGAIHSSMPWRDTASTPLFSVAQRPYMETPRQYQLLKMHHFARRIRMDGPSS